MKHSLETLTRAALALGVLLAGASAPLSADHDDTVYELWVAVYDSGGDEIAVISLDESVLLPTDDSLTLRMITERGGERRTVPTEYRVARGSGTWLNHYRNRPEQGQVTIELHEDAEPRGPLYLEFEILGSVDLASERMRRGTLRVDVVDDRGGYEQKPHDGNLQSSQVVNALYRGILMRDPDPAGARSAEQAIREGGWDAILRVAYNTAASLESEAGIYDRGVSNQQRLVALYRTLQGREAGDVDSYVWREQLDRMGRGDIASVVMELVDSVEFRDHLGLQHAGWHRR